MANKLDLDALHERIKDHDVAMLTTVSQDGYIHSRPMMTQEREPDADLWFVTALDTEKVEEIRTHPKVGVIYYRESDRAYVSLSGVAHLEQNRELIKRKWKESWRAWFPEGPEQANLVLIKIDAHEAEYWEPKGGKLKVIFEAARGMVTGRHPEINPPVQGEIEK